MNKILLTRLFTFGCLLVFAFVSLSAQAFSKPKVVLFYADWNSASRSVKPVIESVVSNYSNKVDLIELNIDSISTPDKARSLNLSVPENIPYVAIIGKKGEILMEKEIKNKPAPQIKSELDSLLLPQL